MHTFFHSHDLLRGLFYGLLAALIWSGHSTATTLGLEAGLSPTDITGLRVLVAGGLLWPYLLKRRKLVQRLGFWRCLLMICCVGVPYGFLNSAGLQFAPVSHAGVICLGLVPLASMVLARWLFGQALTLRALLSMAVMLGGLTIFATGISGIATGTVNSWFGDLLFLICACLWALFGICAARWQVPSLLAVAITSVGSMPFVGFWLGFWPPNFSAIAFSDWVFQAFYQGILVAGVAIYAISRAGAALGAQKSALFSAIAPCGASLVGGWVLSQPVSAMQWLGITVVTVGMVLAMLSKPVPSTSDQESHVSKKFTDA